MKIPKIGFNSKVILVFIAILTPILVKAYIENRNTMKQDQYRKLMGLFGATIVLELNLYYNKYGCYPENLHLIRGPILNCVFDKNIPEKHKDGHLLNEFKYSTDGSKFTLVLELKGKPTMTHINGGLKGEKGWCETYLNGEMIYSKEEKLPYGRN